MSNKEIIVINKQHLLSHRYKYKSTINAINNIIPAINERLNNKIAWNYKFDNNLSKKLINIIKNNNDIKETMYSTSIFNRIPDNIYR
jgi:hypothetical protein